MRTRILIAGFTLSAFFSAGLAFGADPRLMNLVMPDATTLAGANIANAGTTPFGQFVLTQVTAAAGAELQTFVTATGFDPRHDVSEILAASSANAAHGSGVVMALGNFQVSQIIAALASKAPTLTSQTYGGATLITGAGDKSTFSLAFLGTTIAIAGDTASVKAAIDRSSGANSINPALAVQVEALSTSEDAWVVTGSPLASLIPGLGATSGAGSSPLGSQVGQMLSSIQSSSGGIRFGDAVVITGQAVTDSAANAVALANVVQGLVAIASMAGAQDPQFATVAQILQGVKVTANGATINLAVSIPEAQMETILNSLKNAAKPAAKPGIKPAIAPVPPVSAPVHLAAAH
jgi:hypothetical protein